MTGTARFTPPTKHCAGRSEKKKSCDRIVRRAGVERAMNPGHHLPLWAAAATQSQHMLPALFSGLIYAVEL